MGPQSWRKPGILYTNPSIDPDQAPAEGSGRWEQSPFDQTVVMTSSRSSNLPLQAGNSAALPLGIMSYSINYGMYAELFTGGFWPFQNSRHGSHVEVKNGQGLLHVFCTYVVSQVSSKTRTDETTSRILRVNY